MSKPVLTKATLARLRTYFWGAAKGTGRPYLYLVTGITAYSPIGECEKEARAMLGTVRDYIAYKPEIIRINSTLLMRPGKYFSGRTGLPSLLRYFQEATAVYARRHPFATTQLITHDCRFDLLTGQLRMSYRAFAHSEATGAEYVVRAGFNEVEDNIRRQRLELIANRAKLRHHKSRAESEQASKLEVNLTPLLSHARFTNSVWV